MRVLAVDPGEKRLGIAISDPTATIANPLTVLKHVTRKLDAAAIAEIARQNEVKLIVVGHPLDEENRSTPQSRNAARLAQEVREQSQLPVDLWDEAGSTQAARMARIAMGSKRRKRGGHLDELAATYILQTYLDDNPGLRQLSPG